jgi:hypothetical protein
LSAPPPHHDQTQVPNPGFSSQILTSFEGRFIEIQGGLIPSGPPIPPQTVPMLFLIIRITINGTVTMLLFLVI